MERLHDWSVFLLDIYPHTTRLSPSSFDVLGAESMGQIGYVLAQALSSAGCPSTPLLCQVVVDGQHEAFKDPTKFVGPIYGAKEATALSQSLGWVMKPDGEVRITFIACIHLYTVPCVCVCV
jgi:carbamate kinase